MMDSAPARGRVRFRAVEWEYFDRGVRVRSGAAGARRCDVHFERSINK